MLSKKDLSFINTLSNAKFNRYINNKVNNNNIIYIHQLYNEYKLYFENMELHKDMIKKPGNSDSSKTHFFNFDKWCTHLSLYYYNNEHSKYNVQIDGYDKNHCDFWTTYLFISRILLDSDNVNDKSIQHYVHELYSKYLTLIKYCLSIFMNSIDKSRKSANDYLNYFYKKLVIIFQRKFSNNNYTFNDFILVIWISMFILSYFVKYIHNNDIKNINKVIDKQFISFKEAISNL